MEQAQARVKPKQATPLLFEKILKLGRYLTYRAQRRSTPPLQKVLLLRDDAFFKLLSHTGDRGTDLGRIRADQLVWQPKDRGVTLELSFGKTTQGKQSKVITILASEDEELCPIKALRAYIAAAAAAGVTLDT